MRKILSSLIAALMLSGSAMAQDQPVVVELFTSQGCSSCPPADELLHELSKRDDVVALAMHVDYWDYIGWKDIFGNPAHSERQRAYAKAGKRRMVYTPQMIVNGKEQVVGNRPKDVNDLIARHRATPSEVTLNVARNGGQLKIEASAPASVGGPLTVQLVRYKPEATVDILRGENAGRTMSYSSIVTELSILEEWDTNNPLSLVTPVSGDLPIVVLIQHYEHGPIEAVAHLR
ncbi:hypothetical protein PEL8287_01735 [Roseovarius litorisediminis]|uniref:DUF1223 domain-containing protein n=1 Tax=Roseovarius litorisediminis TaxID=1312363 RepID=A0A1Y5SB30_9RHOB|nr:DUF1223 domain-containing protein [Roseovarius litorisediminis]SLN36552.1 hypothetical protein PEL8287_01735 [Roseovarius litorisediminis]